MSELVSDQKGSGKNEFKERSVLAGFLLQKCPRCRQGNVFESPNPYVLLKLSDTYKYCPHCDLRYEQEPGFFTGAMYFSYGMNVAMIVVIGIAMTLLFEGIDAFYVFAVVSAIIVGVMPLTFRYARMLMLYLVGKAKYDRSYAVNGK